jgi:dephospho-CoA kinase
MIVALTGGLASGKSSVARRFEELGVPVIDADVVTRQLVEPGAPALAEIVETFGAGVLDEHGCLNRAKMRERIFDNDGDRRKLESILHPRVRAAMRAFASLSDAPYVLFVIPLLVETDQADRMDRVIVVDAPRALRTARAAARDGSRPETIAAMIDNQATRAERLSVADTVIENADDLATLRERVDAVHRECLALADSWNSVKESRNGRG